MSDDPRDHLSDYDAILPKGDGRIVFVSRLTFGRARINIGDWSGYDDNW